MKAIYEIENERHNDNGDHQRQSSHRASTILYSYTLQHIRQIFTAVRRFFENFVNFFLLDQDDGIDLGTEQIGNEGPLESVGFVFKTIYFDTVSNNRLLVAQRNYSTRDKAATIPDNFS